MYVLRVDRKRERVSLSRKRLLPDPWPAVVDGLVAGEIVAGTVTNVAEFGVFVDLGDGTIIDQATGLMWKKADSGVTLHWEEALAHCEALESAGHDDWRLPNAKELHSIVDYTRAPDAGDPAYRPAEQDLSEFQQALQQALRKQGY